MKISNLQIFFFYCFENPFRQKKSEKREKWNDIKQIGMKYYVKAMENSKIKKIARSLQKNK